MDNCNTHSFRMGAATTAKSVWTFDYHIKVHIRWIKKWCLTKLYIRNSLKDLANSTKCYLHTPDHDLSYARVANYLCCTIFPLTQSCCTHVVPIFTYLHSIFSTKVVLVILYSCWFWFLNQVHAWFLRIDSVHECLYAYVCVCVCPPSRLLITSDVI